MTPTREKVILIALAVLWLALRVPHLATRYCFNWDSSLYARGIHEFSLQKEQPHPPGFPLWVFSARGLTPLAGGPIQGQILLAILIALGGLTVFYLLARMILVQGNTAAMCTLLLAYSPGIALNSSIAASSIVDMLSSAVAGYLAFLDPRRAPWRIVVCLTSLGILAGFREAGVGLLAPFVIFAMLMHWRVAPRAVVAGAALGAVMFLAWYIPLAESVGGLRAYWNLVSNYFLRVSANTSVFMGGPSRRHFGMIAENFLDYGMNFAGWIIASLPLLWHRWKKVPLWRFAAWTLPSIIMILGIHSGRVGQCLQLFPAFVLLCALFGKPRLWSTVAGIAVSLGISYFPYGDLQFSRFWRETYLMYRATPRLALDLEASQRALDPVLRQLKQQGAPEPFVCAGEFPEAPNIASFGYDFSYIRWVLPRDAPPDRTIWVFKQLGPDPETRLRYANWRRIWGDERISVWEASP